MKPMSFQFNGYGDIRLHADCYGNAGDPPVLLLHGGGQTRHAWGGTARALAADNYYAVALDARGHGDSEWDKQGNYTMEAIVGDLLAVIDQLGAEKPVLVGASMGGITSLLAEGEHGNIARALVLVDIATRMEPEGVNRILSFMRAYPEGFANLDEAADAIAKYLPHRPRPKSTKGLEKNLRQRANGRWYWHWDPAFVNIGSRRPRGARDSERLAAAARALTIPTLLVRGSKSDVLSKHGVKEFLEQVPHAEYVDVGGAEHMVAGDKNDSFSNAVLNFLNRLDDTTA